MYDETPVFCQYQWRKPNTSLIDTNINLDTLYHLDDNNDDWPLMIDDDDDMYDI